MFGILNVYKPKGMTSHDVVSVIRRTLSIKRVGHTGTLDPDAEGVLPILVGKATKLSDLLMADEKRYLARVRLGIITDTDDLSGEVIEKKDVSVSKEDILKAVESFLGETEQIPPMYSAIKVDGKKLYQLARKGIVTERAPRKITVYSANVSDFDGTSFNLDVHCSKGTYIRALCRDIGEKLGTGAAMEALIRTQSGMFTKENSHTLEDIKECAEKGNIKSILISPDSALLALSKIDVTKENAAKIKNGIRLRPKQLGIANFTENQMFRVYENGELISILKVKNCVEGVVLAIHKTFY